MKYGPGKCSECNHDWDLTDPNVFPDKTYGNHIFIYFKCSNPECKRIVYTEVDFSEIMRIWYSGELIPK